MNGLDQNFTEISGYNKQSLDRSCFGGGLSKFVRDAIKFFARNNIPNDKLEIFFVEEGMIFSLINLRYSIAKIIIIIITIPYLYR